MGGLENRALCHYKRAIALVVEAVEAVAKRRETRIMLVVWIVGDLAKWYIENSEEIENIRINTATKSFEEHRTVMALLPRGAFSSRPSRPPLDSIPRCLCIFVLRAVFTEGATVVILPNRVPRLLAHSDQKFRFWVGLEPRQEEADARKRLQSVEVIIARASLIVSPTTAMRNDYVMVEVRHTLCSVHIILA